MSERSERERPATAFLDKMRREGLHDHVISLFDFYYRNLVSGDRGLIPDSDIQPLHPSEIAKFEDLKSYSAAGEKALDRAAHIVLNGGLGTSMGLQGPKSLLWVKGERSFLDIILHRAMVQNVPVVLMNSFSTEEKTIAAIEKSQVNRRPAMFLQNKFPKVGRKDLQPVNWPANPELEWNPPGHGDVYTALHTSGVLRTLLDRGIHYAMISNSDNLGAQIDASLLGYFTAKKLPFMMEVAQKTPDDLKGGHIARHRSGRLVLRETAQCPENELDAFMDISRYGYFNTNNLWVDLAAVDRLLNAGGMKLQMIVNPKTLDPRDPESPAVFQIESAMGSAISLFPGAGVVAVPRSRFFPVKTCNELLGVRSDRYTIRPDHRFVLHPDATASLRISLDKRFYSRIDRFEERFRGGIPSLVACSSFTVKGDVFFEENVVARGRVDIENQNKGPVMIANKILTDRVVIRE